MNMKMIGLQINSPGDFTIGINRYDCWNSEEEFEGVLAIGLLFFNIEFVWHKEEPND